jgi:hypothetical protein
MKANYLEGDARAASIKNGEFLRQLHGDEKVTLVIRGFLAGHADVLTKLKGARYAYEFLQLVCDEIQSKQNERERAA